jgi:Tol biopolymer transport system component
LEGFPYPRTIIASVPASGGSGRPVPADLRDKSIRLYNFGGGNRVSPDRKTMVAGAWIPEDVNPEYFFPTARLWKLSLDGTGTTQLTKEKGPFIDTDPSWSPDGKRIAFIRHELIKGRTNDGIGNEDIYIVDSSGGEPELLESIPSDKGISNLVWSTDGKKLACFIRQKAPPWSHNIYVIDMEKGVALTVGEIQNGIYFGHSELAWSPDSKKIAFNYNDDENSGIKVMTLSDGSVEEINTGLTDLDKIVHFDWAPDGEGFVFIGWKTGKREFWMMENILPVTE